MGTPKTSTLSAWRRSSADATPAMTSLAIDAAGDRMIDAPVLYPTEAEIDALVKAITSVATGAGRLIHYQRLAQLETGSRPGLGLTASLRSELTRGH